MIVFSNPLRKDKVSLVDLMSDFPPDPQFELDLEHCSFENLVDYLALSSSPLESYAMALGDHLMTPSLKSMERLIPPSELSSRDEALFAFLQDKYFEELATKPGYEFVSQFTSSLNNLDFPLIACFTKVWNDHFSYQEDDPRFLQLFFSFCDSDRREDVLLLLSDVCIEEKEALWPKEFARPEEELLTHHRGPAIYKMVLMLFNLMLSTESVTLPSVAFLEHLFNAAPVNCNTLLKTLDESNRGLMREIINRYIQKRACENAGSPSATESALFHINQKESAQPRGMSCLQSS